MTQEVALGTRTSKRTVYPVLLNQGSNFSSRKYLVRESQRSASNYFPHIHRISPGQTTISLMVLSGRLKAGEPRCDVNGRQLPRVSSFRLGRTAGDPTSVPNRKYRVDAPEQTGVRPHRKSWNAP